MKTSQYHSMADTSSIWQRVNAVISNWLEFLTALLEYIDFLNLRYHIICSRISSRNAFISYTNIIVGHDYCRSRYFANKYDINIVP